MSERYEETGTHSELQSFMKNEFEQQEKIKKFVEQMKPYFEIQKQLEEQFKPFIENQKRIEKLLKLLKPPMEAKLKPFIGDFCII